jgi:hypothetical protein
MRNPALRGLPTGEAFLLPEFTKTAAKRIKITRKWQSGRSGKNNCQVTPNREEYSAKDLEMATRKHKNNEKK